METPSQNQDQNLTPTQKRDNFLRIIDSDNLIQIQRWSKDQRLWVMVWRGKVEDMWDFLTSTPTFNPFSCEAGAPAQNSLEECQQYTVVWIRDDLCLGLRYVVSARDYSYAGDYRVRSQNTEERVFESLKSALCEAMGLINLGPQRHQEMIDAQQKGGGKAPASAGDLYKTFSWRRAWASLWR